MLKPGDWIKHRPPILGPYATAKLSMSKITAIEQYCTGFQAICICPRVTEDGEVLTTKLAYGIIINENDYEQIIDEELLAILALQGL